MIETEGGTFIGGSDISGAIEISNPVEGTFKVNGYRWKQYFREIHTKVGKFSLSEPPRSNRYVKLLT